MIVRISLIALIGGACLAAESQMEGPKLGFIFDQRAAAVRPILGIPGASMFGTPLSSDLQQAVVSPSQDFAIGVSGGESTVGILNFSSAEVRPLQGANPAPTKIVFSPNGTSAALVHGASVRVFSGLPVNASAGAEYALTAEPVALAVSDDATLVLASIAESEATALFSYSSGGAAHRILSGGRIGAIEFLNHSHDAVFADALENKVILLKDGGDATVLATVDQPGAVAASLDNRKIMAISPAARTITTISLEDGTSVSTSCGCEPSTLARLLGGAVFRITAMGDGPTWIFDTGGLEPRVLFIPHSGAGNE